MQDGVYMPAETNNQIGLYAYKSKRKRRLTAAELFASVKIKISLTTV